MLKYKIDVLAELKNAGYSSYKLDKEHIITARSLHNIRHGAIVGDNILNIICYILNCQPGDIIEYIPDETPPIKRK